MENRLILTIARNGIVAAMYCVVTVLIPGLSYMGVQVRFAELLILLCFFRKDYSIGLILGCFLANLFSPLGWVDMVFGTLATAISCLAICFMKNLFFSTLIPAVANGIIVGAEIVILFPAGGNPWVEFLINAGLVALGEVIAISIIGYIFFMLLGKREGFQNVIGANQNLDFKW